MPALLGGAAIALVAANIYLYVQIDRVRSDVAAMQNKLSNELTTLRDSANVTTEAQKRHLETLKEELDAARAQARMAASQARRKRRPMPNRRGRGATWGRGRRGRWGRAGRLAGPPAGQGGSAGLCRSEGENARG